MSCVDHPWLHPICTLFPLPRSTAPYHFLAGVHWYDVTPLTTSVPLYFRVTPRAVTSGYGASTVATPRPLAPVQSANAPRDLVVSTADLQPSAPITFIDVAWDTPASNGGLALSAYKVRGSRRAYTVHTPLLLSPTPPPLIHPPSRSTVFQCQPEVAP